MNAQQAQLAADVALCEIKLDRATKLIGGLGGEKTRWTEVRQPAGEITTPWLPAARPAGGCRCCASEQSVLHGEMGWVQQ
jgi:hypothetical protein